ncbi:hypothetical protein OOZ15_16640 [Galbibacter sp. EGI 63066]|uniref:hypothetical protein n=1 Tax=Galbibacter sp. EGI 63066 TaxID=2993559 RepID=UPI0022494925|nr:hypothetical protein [Galbibacter sp. EGI 63066]MCX2681584.1 hypothetical protein [Galbibacter sp. EGI 63066]
MPNKISVTVTKIIAYYCLFYAAVKVYAIIKGMWPWPNVIIGVFLGIIAFIGFKIIQRNTYNWYFIGICVVLLSLLRYYESQLMSYLEGIFG